jgi:hypothetical protein
MPNNSGTVHSFLFDGFLPNLSPALRGYSLSGRCCLRGRGLSRRAGGSGDGAGGRQSIQPIKDTAHLRGQPKSMPSCCRNAACGESRGDGIRLIDAARPYLGNHRSKRGGPRICLRCAYPAGSLAGLRRCHRFDCHLITLTGLASRPPGNPSPGEGQGLGPSVQDSFIREMTKGHQTIYRNSICGE